MATLRAEKWTDIEEVVGWRLDGCWLTVTDDAGRKREGWCSPQPDGSLVLIDDNGDHFIFDRDVIADVVISPSSDLPG